MLMAVNGGCSFYGYSFVQMVDAYLLALSEKFPSIIYILLLLWVNGVVFVESRNIPCIRHSSLCSRHFHTAGSAFISRKQLLSSFYFTWALFGRYEYIILTIRSYNHNAHIWWCGKWMVFALAALIRRGSVHWRWLNMICRQIDYGSGWVKNVYMIFRAIEPTVKHAAP